MKSLERRKDELQKLAKPVKGYHHDLISDEFPRDLDGFSGNVIQTYLHCVIFLANEDHRVLDRAMHNVKRLQLLLNKSEDDVYKLLVHILVRSQKEQNRTSFESEDSRAQWETDFRAFLINSLGSSSGEDIYREYDEAIQQDNRAESIALVQNLRPNYDSSLEDLSLNELRKFGQVWKYFERVSLESLSSTLLLNGHRFPLLSSLLENQKAIPFLTEIPQLISMFESLSGLSDVLSSSNRPFGEFLEANTELTEESKNSFREIYLVYCEVWNTFLLEQNRNGQLVTPHTLPLDFNSPLKYSLPTNHARECSALFTITFLINKNNDIVQKYRSSLDTEQQLAFIHFFLRAFSYLGSYCTTKLFVSSGDRFSLD